MKPTVLKFGGTSVGSAGDIRRSAAIAAEAARRGPVVVVVSAMAGVTNELLALADDALMRRRDDVARRLAALVARHGAAADALLAGAPRETDRRRAIDSTLAETETLATGVGILGELTPRSLDAMASVGERLTPALFAAALAACGATAAEVDAREVIVTDDDFGHAAPDLAVTRDRAAQAIAPLLAQGTVVVAGGFIGATIDGRTTTLGRGGSDTSASILGVVLDAAEVQIWTDVDGILTCDPRLVESPRLIPEISFAQAAELSHFGAKVLHPNSIKLAVDHGIPVRVANSFAPGGTGTVITAAGPRQLQDIVAIACRPGVTLLSVSSLRMFMAHGFLARVFAVFEKHRTPIDLVSTSHTSTLISLDDTARLGEIGTELRSFCEVELIERGAIVCAVGSGFLQRSGVARRIFNALEGINVRMVTLASDISFSIVVDESDMRPAARALHEALLATGAPA